MSTERIFEPSAHTHTTHSQLLGCIIPSPSHVSQHRGNNHVHFCFHSFIHYYINTVKTSCPMRNSTVDTLRLWHYWSFSLWIMICDICQTDSKKQNRFVSRQIIGTKLLQTVIIPSRHMRTLQLNKKAKKNKKLQNNRKERKKKQQTERAWKRIEWPDGLFTSLHENEIVSDEKKLALSLTYHIRVYRARLSSLVEPKLKCHLSDGKLNEMVYAFTVCFALYASHPPSQPYRTSNT